MSELKKIKELHYLLEMGPSGIKTYEGNGAMNQRIYDWLAHPVGSIADKPEWGHLLGNLKFEPQSSQAKNAYKMSIMSKIEDDVLDLVVESVEIDFLSIDEVGIKICHNYGETSKKIARK